MPAHQTNVAAGASAPDLSVIPEGLIEAMSIPGALRASSMTGR
jgi:hypothetical protein